MAAEVHNSMAGVGETLANKSEADLRRKLAALEDGVSEHAIDQIARLLRLAQEQGWSLKRLCRESGMSEGTLSQIFNATYKGNYDLRARPIERFLMDQEKRALFGGRDEFVETEVARGLFTIFDKTRYNRRIQVIQSPEQLGKSRAADEYTHRNNGTRTVKVTLQPGGSSNPFGVFLREAALSAGLKDVHVRKIIDLRFDLRDALSVCDLVILDEFHLIEYWSDRAIRDLLDFIRVEIHANGKRGVVLLATNADVFTLLQSFRRRAHYNIGQLIGRMCNQVLELSPDEIPVSDVLALAERYYKPGKRCVDKLHDIASRPKLGHYGLLLDILNRAWTECKVGGGKMTDELVLGVAEETMEEIGRRKDVYA